MAPISILGGVDAPPDFQSQILGYEITQLVLKHEVLGGLVNAKEREPLPLLKVILRVLIITEVAGFALLGARLDLLEAPVLGHIVEVVIALQEADLDVAFQVFF